MRYVHTKLEWIGIKNGDKIRLAALGNPGKNGGKNGDLIIHVKLLEDPEFKIEGTDFNKDINITPAVAALGGKYKLQVMDEKLFVSLPKRLRDGEIVTVPNKGYVTEDVLVKKLKEFKVLDGGK